MQPFFAFWDKSNTGVAEGTAYTVFNGSRSFQVSHYSDINFDWNTEFTISFWCSRLSSSNERIVIGKAADSTSPGWFIIQRNEAARRFSIIFRDSAGGFSECILGTSLTPGGDFLVTIYYSGANPNTASSYRMFLNGTEVATTQFSTGFNTALSMQNNADLQIGNMIGYTGFFGHIDDVTMFQGNFGDGLTGIIPLWEAQRAMLGAGLAKRTPQGIAEYLVNQPVLYCRMGDNYTYDGTTLTYPNEANTAFPATSTNTDSSAIASPAKIVYSEYLNATEKVEWKNLNVYETWFNNWSHGIARNSNDSSYVGYAQSTKKLVGEGRIHWWKNGGSNIHHAYIGISDEATPIGSPNAAGNRWSFGIGNGGYIVYDQSTILHNGAVPALWDLMTLEVIGDDFIFKKNGVTEFTALGARLQFPNGFYIYPCHFYVGGTQRVAWECWFDLDGLAGSLQDNNLI